MSAGLPSSARLQARVDGGKLFRFVAALARMGELPLVAHHRPGGVVELQIAAAGVIEGAQRLARSSSHVVEKLLQIGIDLFADRLPARAKMQHAGRRHGHFRANARVFS
jgi:hypothetical protein